MSKVLQNLRNIVSSPILSNLLLLIIYFSLGSFWNQSVNSNSKETPLFSMRQRPLIVPATLHFSGLQQGRFATSHTRQATNGKRITNMVTLNFPFNVTGSVI